MSQNFTPDPTAILKERQFSRVVLDDYQPDGWLKGAACVPGAVGLYDRRSSIGIRTDWWDGKEWRRAVRGTHGERRWGGGVVCANQDLDWREA